MSETAEPQQSLTPTTPTMGPLLDPMARRDITSPNPELHDDPERLVSQYYLFVYFIYFYCCVQLQDLIMLLIQNIHLLLLSTVA